MAKLRKGLKAELTFADPAQVTIEDGTYVYKIYALEAGQRISWGPEGKYWSRGPGLLEVEFSYGSMRTMETNLDDPNIWKHVTRLMIAGRKALNNE